MIIDEYPISDCEVQNSSESVILDSLPSSFTSISVPTSVQQQCAICNKSLKIPKWQSGIINQRGTDNAMAKRKGTKGPTTIYNALYRKLKFEQQQHYKIRAVNSQSGHLLSIYFLCHIGLWLRSATTCFTSFSVVPAISKISPQIKCLSVFLKYLSEFASPIKSIDLIKTQISHLARTTRFWNNIHQVRF